jgi:hypothetical protein
MYEVFGEWGVQQCCYICVEPAKEFEWPKPEEPEADANLSECVLVGVGWGAQGVWKLGMQQCRYVGVELAKNVEWQKPDSGWTPGVRSGGKHT